MLSSRFGVMLMPDMMTSSLPALSPGISPSQSCTIVSQVIFSRSQTLFRRSGS